MYDDDFEYDRFPRPPAPSSGLGIASFVIALSSGFFLLLVILVAAMSEAAHPGIMDDDTVPVVILLGVGVLTCVAVSLVGIGLGIGGLCQKDRRTVFAALGLSFNILICLAILCLGIIGALTS